MYAKVDFAIGIFLIIFSAAAHYLAGKMPAAKQGLGPGDYPKVILKVLFILGLSLAVSSFVRIRKAAGKNNVKNFDKNELKNVLILFLCVAVYIWLVNFLGFIILTPFFLFALMYILGLKKWFRMIAISVLTTAVVYLIFNRLLLVLLPRFSLF
jgi:putative tricarboxylic transport membrane protein